MNGMNRRISLGFLVLCLILLMAALGSFWKSVQRQRAYERLRENHVLVFYEGERWADLLEITSADPSGDVLKAPTSKVLQGRQKDDAKFAFFVSDSIEPSVWDDLKHFPEIRGFCMSVRFVNENDLRQISSFNQLEELCLLAVESSIGAEAIEKLRQMPSMKQLILPREIAIKYNSSNRTDLGPVWNGYDEIHYMWDSTGEGDQGRRGMIFANAKRSFAADKSEE